MDFFSICPIHPTAIISRLSRLCLPNLPCYNEKNANERAAQMVRKRDYINAWINDLTNEDKINQALLELNRNESRYYKMYQRDLNLTPPMVSTSNNSVTIIKLNAAIKYTLHTLLDELYYLHQLKQNDRDTMIQQVILNEHIEEEEARLIRYLNLLNNFVGYTYTVKLKPKAKN